MFASGKRAVKNPYGAWAFLRPGGWLIDKNLA